MQHSSRALKILKKNFAIRIDLFLSKLQAGGIDVKSIFFLLLVQFSKAIIEDSLRYVKKVQRKRKVLSLNFNKITN